MDHTINIVFGWWALVTLVLGAFEYGKKIGRKENAPVTLSGLEWLCPYCLPDLRLKFTVPHKAALEYAKHQHMRDFHQDILDAWILNDS
jgi:hypothetical protein